MESTFEMDVARGWRTGFDDACGSGNDEFDVVLLDLNMPKRGGSEVLEKLRGESTAGDRADFIGFSGGQDAGLRLGATHYIRKPTGLDDFLAIGATIKEIVAQA